MLQWFRKKVRAGGPAPVEAAPPAQLERAGDGSTQAEPTGEEEAKRRRRRGTRGGRGRKKAGDGAAAPAVEAPAKAEPRRKAEGPARDRRRRASTRRATTPTPASFPDVKKEILVSVDVGEQRVAVLEDGKPAEVYLERPGRRSIAGNVYKGVVDNVLPGMEASFVEIGLDRNGFLYVDEIVVPELEGKKHGRKIQELVQRGQEVLVQAVKDPMGTKGARLTTEISLPGRFVVYTPFGEGLGISRRLEDAERERLKAITKELDLPEGGVIVRTAAEGASKEELEGDLALLRKLWSTIQGRAARTKAPALVYQEAELPLRIVRDLFIRDFERVVVDHDRTYRRIVGYLKRTSQELAERVELYTGKERLMEKGGVDDAVRSTLDRRVDLPSGGYLIFDYAEAFTVIDVNTGRFVGGRGKASGARLEDTITKNNLEAVAEVVRQLRLRDVGGIIVIDFIDMANPKNRELVEEALRRELARDRTKTYVVEISPLGLVEMTRQNVTDGPREILTVACPTCDGDGIVVSEETHAVTAERELRHLSGATRHQAFRVELNARVAPLVIGAGAARIAELERETGKRFFVEARDDTPSDHFVVLEKGPASKLEPKRLPLAPGDELAVALEAPDGQPVADAIARVDGYLVAVAGSGARAGRKAKIRIERATPSAAYAVLADAESAEAPVETGVEVETDEGAAAPRRRPRSRARAAPKVAEAPTGGEGQPDSEAEVEPGPESGAEAEPSPDGEPKPKRRRRGSRGGRGRKRRSAAELAAGNGAPDETVAAVGVSAPEAPAAEEGTETPSSTDSDGAAEERPKKKTRRGSRGGRNRRRKRGALEGEVQEDARADAEPTAPPGEDSVVAVAAPEEPG